VNQPASRALQTALFWMLRAGLGALMLVPGVLKLLDPASFATEIHNYQLLPELAPVLAAALPAVEITLGVAIILGPRRWVRAGALGAAALLAVFTVAVGSVVARGVNISCGCFGAGSGPITALTVVRDVALLAASAALFALAADAPTTASAAPATAR
jgi:uncharacterized membrane protein YphA (DoxX/SURF4 family)